LEEVVTTVGDAGENQVWAKDALYRSHSSRGVHVRYSRAI